MGGQGVLRLISERDDGERGGRRFRVLLSASLVTTTNEVPVKLKELSCGDAMVEGLRLPPTGADVILKRGGLEIFATVAWSSGRHAALAFEEAIPETELLAQIHRVSREAAATVEGATGRPGFRGGRLTDAERQLASEWAQPVGRQAYRD
jgi:hypothetical protein